MPAIVRLSKQGLNDLINSVKENGGDVTELNKLMAEVNEDEKAHRPVRRIGNPLRVMVEEPTVQEYLEVKVGELFPEGITEPILADVIEFARNYTLKELRKMCKEAGLGSSGEKKELAAKLMARGVP